MLISIIGFGIASGHLPPGGNASADAQHMVSLYADGQKRVFSTEATTVGDVLHRAGVTLGNNDLVEPSTSTVIPEGFFNINVYRARPVVVIDGYRSYRFTSAYQSPRLLAEQAGLTVYPEDTYTMKAVTDIVGNVAIGDEVTIKRAVPLTIHVDGSNHDIRTQATTVGEAVKTAGIALGINDTVSSGLSAAVSPDMTVSISRVAVAVADITVPLPRPTQTTTDATMLKGQTVVKSEGADGSKVVTYRIHYRDGVETGREQLAVVSQTDAQPKVVVVGTKVLFAGSVEYWRSQVIAAATENGLDPNMMMRIMSCESSGNALANNGNHFGLYQYLSSTWRSAGGTDSNIFDGPTQITLTAKYMAAHGTGAWQCK